MPVILLVRHGQASFGADDYDQLSELGIEQSRVVGKELVRRQLRDPLIVTGTLRRQRDTALHAGLGPAVVDGGWDEYDHLDLLRRHSGAAADGVDSRSVQVLLDAALLAWVTGAESDGWPAFVAGASGALREVVGAGRDAVVVTSGGVITGLCGALLGLAPQGIVALNRVMANAAITKIVVGRSGTSLVAINDHAHFEGDDSRLLTYR